MCKVQRSKTNTAQSNFLDPIQDGLYLVFFLVKRTSLLKRNKHQKAVVKQQKEDQYRRSSSQKVPSPQMILLSWATLWGPLLIGSITHTITSMIATWAMENKKSIGCDSYTLSRWVWKKRLIDLQASYFGSFRVLKICQMVSLWKEYITGHDHKRWKLET